MSARPVGRIGFVGTGTITKAIIEGLMAAPRRTAADLLVSPRNAEIAAGLAAAHPGLVVAADNQAVVDGAEIVFLAVRPQIAAEVVPALRFRPGQLVVSLIAATERARLLGWIDAEVDLVQAIPLPFVEDRRGATAVHPPHPQVLALFDLLGTAVPCATRQDYDLLAAASATMSLFFGQMGRIVEWLEARGLPQEAGRAYLAAHFESLAKVAVARPETPLSRLAEEFATRGGLNEQVWQDVDQHGGTAALTSALDRVFARITGSR